MSQCDRHLLFSSFDRIAILQRESMRADRKGQDKIEPCYFKPETYVRQFKGGRIMEKILEGERGVFGKVKNPAFAVFN